MQSSPLGVRTGPGPDRRSKGSKDGTESMLRLFRFERQKEETLVDYHARACNTARKTWVQMGVPSLYEVIAGSMWRAVGWVCDERPNAVINTLKRVCRWRSTRWWQSTQARTMKADPCNHHDPLDCFFFLKVAPVRARYLGKNGHGLGG